MKNIFINDFRRNERKKFVMDTIMYSRDGFSPAEDRIRLKEIKTAIHNLPAIFKTCCELYLQGYQYNEIATYLGEPLGTIKSRIHFSKKLLQKQIPR